MTRTIKASEVKPGMTIRWARGDISSQCNLAGVERFNDDQDIQGETKQGLTVLLRGNEDVLVVKEPPQPEEPRWVAARARVGDYLFFRVDESDRAWRRADCMGRVFPYWYTWDEICGRGTVTVIPDQGWTVPADGEPATQGD